VSLTQEEKVFLNSFPNSEKSYILTGDTQSSFDFTQYQSAGFNVENLPQEEVFQEHNHWQYPNLFFDPSTSDSDSSEDFD
jgi:hypothetical protein